jgi:hypothetical protein
MAIESTHIWQIRIFLSSARKISDHGIPEGLDPGVTTSNIAVGQPAALFLTYRSMLFLLGICNG